MNTAYWRTLIEIADSGSFARAADQLCVTQSCLSRRVQALENHYDCELVNRSNKPVTLTAVGEIIAARTRDIIAEEARISRRVAELKGCRRIDFACTSAFGITGLPKVLQLLMARSAGKVDLVCSVGTVHSIIGDMAAGNYHLAVVDHCTSLDLGELTAIAFSDEEMVFACSANVQPSKGESIWATLLEQTLVVRSEASCGRRLLEAELESKRLTIDAFRKVIIADDLNVTLNLLKSGDAVAYLPRSLFDSSLNELGQITLITSGLHSCLRRSLIHNTTRAPTEAAVLLQQAILDTIA